jgi:putative FmdB family regulatory protein
MMPTYTYRCESCTLDFEKFLPMSRFREPQACPECGASPATKTVTATNFILKGDGWAGKNNRIRGQMAKKNQRLAQKENEYKKDAGIKLAPNVGGQRVDSWSEASKLAASQGKDTSGYDSLARKEKND